MNESECVNHPGPYDGTGYGQIRVGGVLWKAHRLAWLAAGKELFPGMELHHVCENRLCINVDHLQQVTHGENIRARSFSERPGNGSGRRKGISREGYATRTHCANGHDWNETNVRMYRGYGHCRICQADAQERHRLKYRAEQGY
jgi:hypothetical protein